MRGVSKIIATEQDVINNMAIDKQATKQLLIQMRDGRFAWVKSSLTPLSDRDPGLVDETHKVTVEPLDGDVLNDDPKNMARFQWEYTEDPNCSMYRAGLTLEKVNRYIEECSE